MTEEQRIPAPVIEEIPAEQLLKRVMELKLSGYRLSQICAAYIGESFELSYSFAEDTDYAYVILRVVIPPEEEIPSVTEIVPQAFFYENEMKELFGVKIAMIRPDYRNKLYRITKEAPFGPAPAQGQSRESQTAVGEKTRLETDRSIEGKRSVIPFGPQHPVLPEPIHIDLVIEDETVVEAIPSVGFIHRGLEGLAAKRDFQTLTYVAERTCGICSFQHGMGYCEAVEHVFGLEIPIRARFLRTIWAELGRMHSHLLWLGLLADGFGYENLFYQCWRVREKVLDLQEATTGGRLIFSVNKIGGVLKDISPELLNLITEKVKEVREELLPLQKTFREDYSVLSRLKGVGVLTKEQVHALGCCGPVMRASGWETDMRLLGYGAYPMLDFAPVTASDGDAFSRCDCRIREVFQSIDLILQAIGRMPEEKELAVPFKGNPNGEYFCRVEQPRGEAVYYVKGSGKPFLDRFRIRTPTFANLPGLCEMLKNTRLADVGLLVLTIDPCISCTER